MLTAPPDDAQCTRIDFFDSPKEVAIDVLDDDLLLLLGGGIVNPFGPTLTLLVAIGQLEVGRDLPIVHASLNPFQQTVRMVGSLKLREYTSPCELLCQCAPHAPGGCPTALLLSPFIALIPEAARATATAVLGLWLSACEDGNLTLESVRSFPGDPVARVKHDVERSFSIFKAQREGQAVDFPESRRLNTNEAMDLALLQLDRNHWEKEWGAFVDCWHEAIDSQQKTGLARMALPWVSISAIWAKVADPSHDILKKIVPNEST